MGGWTVSSVAPWEGGRLAVLPHGRVDGKQSPHGRVDG